MSHRFTCRVRWISSAVLVLAALGLHAQQKPVDPNRWEPAIKAFETQDQQSPPAKGQIVFVGASSIVRWKLPESFPDLEAINRGFGGSYMSDSTRYATRIVVPYQPRIVVLYPGENDIAAGVTPEAEAKSFAEFVDIVHGALPRTRIVMIGLKPTPARWQFMEQMRRANTLNRAHCESHQPCVFVSVEKDMLGADQRPRPELFVADGQHMSPEGYKIWTRLVRPHLD
jgi:lysophospholipase L1-like esterase